MNPTGTCEQCPCFEGDVHWDREFWHADGDCRLRGPIETPWGWPKVYKSDWCHEGRTLMDIEDEDLCDDCPFCNRNNQ